jgi:hypothetical protein
MRNIDNETIESILKMNCFILTQVKQFASLIIKDLCKLRQFGLTENSEKTTDRNPFLRWKKICSFEVFRQPLSLKLNDKVAIISRSSSMSEKSQEKQLFGNSE